MVGKGLSPWAISANEYFNQNEPARIFQTEIGHFIVFMAATGDSLWIVLEWPDGCQTAFRAVYSPESNLQINSLRKETDRVLISLSGKTGTFHVNVNFHEEDALLRYTTSFTAAQPLLVPFWPKDILVLNCNHPHVIEGNVHIQQEGARSGLIYFSTKKQGGSVLYMQNLTSLNNYFQATETSAAGLVGGAWPEIGFSLPVSKELPLPADKEYIISDAYVAFVNEIPKTEISKSRLFLNLLAVIYRKLPLPETEYIHYPDLVKKSITDISTSYGCWLQIGNKSYLNAYNCDYNTPPEVMVQLAALLPMYDYSEWIGEEVGLEKKLLEGLPEFYDEKLKTIMRWLPAAEGNLDKSEEQKQEKVMDSWYLHHPLLNLSRLALKGNTVAEKLFLDSLEFAIKVAHHFNYQWPVFYNMQTLEVLKAESKPGNGGEKDVAGIYAAVMLQAWELTRKKKYLKEAEKAARTLEKHGINLFYQANNTAFSAKALLRLYQITKDELFIDLSYLCIAGIMKNVHLWECNYGYARHYPTFFALYPLNDAPYTAAYEEQEVFAALHEYLQISESIDVLPSVKMLTSEFIRNFINRAAYYFPPLLPDEVLSKEVKTGEISPNLHLALEDLQDGWIQSGSVGQEVYGAGLAFGVAPRHYIRTDANFLIYTDNPVGRSVRRSAGSVSINILGDEQFNCRLLIIPEDGKALPKVKVSNIENNKRKEIKGVKNKLKQLEFTIAGGQKISVSW